MAEESAPQERSGSPDFRCPKCRAHIDDGQIYCGNCKTDLAWVNGIPQVSAGQKLQDAGNSLMKVGSALQGLGCLLTLLVTIPILFVMCGVLGR